MSTTTSPNNLAAWLTAPSQPLKIGEAPMPTPGPNEIVVKNAAVAINPLDNHMQDHGVFITHFPAIFGCDVAGTIYAVGSGVDCFSVGDRVIGHTVSLVTGDNTHAAFQSYTLLPATKTALLPPSIPLTSGVVLPFALEAAICALCLSTPGIALPGVPTPALGLPYPSFADNVASIGKTLVVYGASSSVGSMVVQIATRAGVDVVALAGPKNADMVKKCGAKAVFDHKSPTVMDDVVDAVKQSGNTFEGVFDAISSAETYAVNLAVLERLGGGHLACTHPPPVRVPKNVQAGMIFAVNDVATPVWEEFVTPALEKGQLLCLPPPTVVGKGLEFIEQALKMCKAGVSATKLVVEL